VAPNNERYCSTAPEAQGCNIHHAPTHSQHEREYSPQKDSSWRTCHNKPETAATFLQLWKTIRHYLRVAGILEEQPTNRWRRHWRSYSTSSRVPHCNQTPMVNSQPTKSTVGEDFPNTPSMGSKPEPKVPILRCTEANSWPLCSDVPYHSHTRWLPHDPRMWRRFSNLVEGYRCECLTGVVRCYYTYRNAERVHSQRKFGNP